MASVDSKTSLKIDELIDGSIISGAIDGSGHLILTTRGGASIDAGFVAKQNVSTWSSATSYIGGDIVGYAGQIWQAASNNTNKPPALNTSVWTRLVGESHNDWSEKNPRFDADSLADWDVSYKTGSPTAALTSVAGEFETGLNALKLSLPVNSVQRAFQKEENLVRDGEVITVTVRAKLISASANASITVEMLQNKTNTPVPGASGNTVVNPNVFDGAPYALTTSWANYVFTLSAAAALPRAYVAIVASAGATASCVMLIDRISISRRSSPALEAWPVGSIFFTSSSTSPKELLGGGVWQAFGAGRVPVGVDVGQTEFDTVEKTGGAKTHTLAISEMPAHDHGAGSYSTSTDGSHTHGPGDYSISSRASTGSAGGAAQGNTTTAGTPPVSGTSGSGGSHSHGVNGTSGSRGGDGAHNNLQPYIAVYMWKRLI